MLATLVNSPTALFESYEQDYKQIVDSIAQKLDGEQEDGGVEQSMVTLRRTEMELDEADEMVSQMEIEVQNIPQSIRPQYQARIRSPRNDLTRFKRLCKEKHQQLSRSNLLSTSGRAELTSNSDAPYESTSDRARLITGSQLLDEASRRLQDSQRIALETEDQGAEILMSLRTQREQIENARDTLHVADTSIDRASITLKKMIRRIYQQRAVTAAIIVVLFLLIGIIIWEKLS